MPRHRNLVDRLSACIAHRRGLHASSEDLATADLLERCKNEIARLKTQLAAERRIRMDEAQRRAQRAT